MSHFIVGLTGGIGSGKTTVANIFSTHGIELVDADQVARQVVEPGLPALNAIAEHFGDAMLNSDGSLNRAEMRRLVFADPTKREWLEQLTHPIIRQQMIDQLQQAKSPYALLVSPLLFETDQHRLCDHTVVVDISEQQQIERSCRRDSNSEQQIRAIMQAQCTRDQRLAQADSLVDNSAAPELLFAQVASLHQQLLKLAEQAATQD